MCAERVIESLILLSLDRSSLKVGLWLVSGTLAFDRLLSFPELIIVAYYA